MFPPMRTFSGQLPDSHRVPHRQRPTDSRTAHCVLVVLFLSCLAPAGVGERLAAVVREQTAEANRAARLARQRELNAWFHEHGRRLPREAEYRNETDRRNADEFPGTMSNFHFLDLPRRDRRRAAARLAAHAQAVAEHGEDALRALFPQPPAPLLERWRNPPAVRAASLGGFAAHAPEAVYAPASATIYLDFNRAVDPAAFADAFEHELWHHLVPIVQPPEVADNLFWEGFNEALSELWGAELHRRGGLGQLGSGKVSYPVATALASLCLATDRDGTLAWLLGERDRAAFADTLAPRLPALAAEFRAQPAIGDERQRRIEAVLAEWNWRETDGSPARIDTFLADGAICPDRVSTAFRLNRAYLEAFIEAQAVVWMQDALAERGRNRLLALGRETLPAHLQANLARVFNYLRNPSQRLH